MDTKIIQQQLEQELATLELELTDVGAIIPGGHDARTDRRNELEIDTEDRNILADKFEEASTDAGIADALLERYHNVQAALARIANGTYGTCATCGEKIAEDRVEANPAADTCVEHAK